MSESFSAINSEHFKDCDDAWEQFVNNQFQDDGICENEVITDNTSIPKCSDIYISTKTKIVYLNKQIDLEKVFWNIDIIEYYKPQQGVVKKQMKFNFNSKEQVKLFEEKISKLENIDQHIISKIDNPQGRIKFKDIRKLTIGFSNKDIVSFKAKKRSAFYNCFVAIFRVFHNDEYKEVHVKVFNTGKLEIPGIRDDNLLSKTLDLAINLFQHAGADSLSYDKDKCETVLINSNFNCGFYINRDKLLDILKKKYNIDCVFDACQYPGIQCKYTYVDNDDGKNDVYKLSFMVFRTGSILIVGRCGENILYKIYEILKKILEDEYKNIYTANFDVGKNTNKEKKIKKKTILVLK